MGALTITNFCELYQLSRTTAYDLIIAGELDGRKVGAKTLISRESAEAWFKTRPKFVPGAMPYGHRRPKGWKRPEAETAA